MKDEAEEQDLIQIQARHHNSTLMRNNSGCLENKYGTPVRYGLGNVSKKHNTTFKSSDLIGITKVLITKEMVGQTLGVFTAVEVKDEKWNPDKKLDARETAQNNFINWVKLNGGYAGFCNAAEKVKNILKGE